MEMELEGRIVRKLSVQSGNSARGSWSKQEFIFEYQEGNYPTKVVMHVWGDDKVRELDKYQVNDKVKVSFNLSSREYNGRWYTDVRAWRIEPAGATGSHSAPAQGYDYAASAGSYAAPMGTGAPLPSADDMSSPFSDEDLPF